MVNVRPVRGAGLSLIVTEYGERGWVRKVVAYVEDGTETADLRRCRVELTRPAA